MLVKFIEILLIIWIIKIIIDLLFGGLVRKAIPVLWLSSLMSRDKDQKPKDKK